MKKYLITSPDYYSDDAKVFCDKLTKSISKYSPDYILFRDKTNQNYKQLAKDFISLTKAYKNIKSFIHQDIELASRLKAHGVHLNSTQLDLIPLAKSKKLEVIVSTHTLEDIKKAQNLGADALTYSPIFETPNKGKPKGLEVLKNIVNKMDINIFALGGIVEPKHVNILKDSGVYGFASIRYFYI